MIQGGGEITPLLSRTGFLVKRIFDVFFSFFGLVFLFPLLVLIGVIVKIDSEGPVFYRQVRVGKKGRLFKIFKFRTMFENADKAGGSITIRQDRRITKSGRILRKYKLDEFPQLLNVLKGDMSLVGPRPEVPEFVNLYDQRQRSVLLIRPGITDYASIEFSDESEMLGMSSSPREDYINRIMPEKLELNLLYLDTMSLLTDLRIIFKTLLKVFI